MSRKPGTMRAARLAGGAAALAALATLAAGCGSGKSDAIEERSGAPEHGIEIDAGAADVVVTSGGQRDVTMRVETSGAFGPKLSHVLDGGRLEIQGGCRHGLFCSAKIVVGVPEGTDVTVRSDAGDVSLVGRFETVDVEADAGDLSLDLRTAPASVISRTDAGDVDVDLPAGRYATTVETDAGDDEVHGVVQDDTAPRTIDVRTDAGDISIDGSAA